MISEFQTQLLRESIEHTIKNSRQEMDNCKNNEALKNYFEGQHMITNNLLSLLNSFIRINKIMGV